MIREHDTDESADQDVIEVPIAWEALSDAFENNSPEVQSYLNLATGEVVRLIDDVADPIAQRRIAHDPEYLLIDPVSSREQYRWMERFIESMEHNDELRAHLQHAIDGKGAFRRFKDVLMTFPTERERWFAFRAQRLRACMESWLTAHSIHAVERPQWEVPAVEEMDAELIPAVSEAAPPPPRARPAQSEVAQPNLRQELHDLVEQMSSRDLPAAKTYLEFLMERNHSRHSERRQSYSEAIRAEGEDAPLEVVGDKDRKARNAG
jgi:hypothetical protein